MDIQKIIKSIPDRMMLALVAIIVIAFLFHASGNWNRQIQSFFILAFIVVILLSIKEQGSIIDLDEAKKIAVNYARKKLKEGVLEPTTIIEEIDGTLRERNGKPWYYEVAVKTNDMIKPYLVMSIMPRSGKVISSMRLRSWSAREAPNVEILSPPDLVSWLKLKRAIDEQIEKSAG